MADNNTSTKPSSSGNNQQAPAGLGSNPPIWRYNSGAGDSDCCISHHGSFNTSDAGDGASEQAGGDGSNSNKQDDSIPVPWWFNPPSARAYRNLSMYEDDIIISSGIKMGTTWVTKLLISLLYEYDNEGNLKEENVKNRHKIPGRDGQTYPDALYPTREEKEADALGIDKRMPGGAEKGGGMDKIDVMFGNFVFEDVVNQPRPRMISSHLFGKKYLPKELFDEQAENKQGDGTAPNKRKGKGRLIIVLRNLKDTLVSLHNFRGTAIDGWLGNSHGPGSFKRFINLENCPNAMGSAFHWVRENGLAVQDINNNNNNSEEEEDKKRALVIYYESLIMDFQAELQRINTFLELPPLTSAKANAIEKACMFKTMESSSMRTKCNCRKGGMLGWKDVQELRDEYEWREFDAVFQKVLGDVEIAQPMRYFHERENNDSMPPGLFE